MVGWCFLLSFVVFLPYGVNMALMSASYERPRKSYQKIKPSIEAPYLIEIQKISYKKFLQAEIDHQANHHKRRN